MAEEKKTRVSEYNLNDLESISDKTKISSQEEDELEKLLAEEEKRASK